MSFDDIFGDIFDLDEKQPAEDITSAEKNSGFWDTGTKENIWRTQEPAANGVWDSGCSGPCDDCDCDDDADCDIDENDLDDEDEWPDDEHEVGFDEDGFLDF